MNTVNIDTLISQQERLAGSNQDADENRENMIEKDYLIKRQRLLADQYRLLSHLCFKACSQTYSVSKEIIAITDLNPQEENCLGRCSLKSHKINQLIERHIDDSFTPQFFSKFIA
ncbi:UNKNOWN [Stylonychia lemnae]|uniref:Mitochondrial import inner membrane translocase subunit n=1 Tax=Stylonychia lemnae TaxID=5949 RepID=A0A078BCN2_STYLE|nr:UNKNOWN [Stylonychia lemnae]|eukprot:CDW90967.1 UNKNOWN [Stylonychia lemnae]